MFFLLVISLCFILVITMRLKQDKVLLSYCIIKLYVSIVVWADSPFVHSQKIKKRKEKKY